MMYKITPTLATIDIDVADSEPLYNDLQIKGWYLIDIRDMADDGTNKLDVYRKRIDEAVELLELHCNVVIGCDAGISRSNSIALGVLVKQGMDFYNAWELVRQKVPRCNIDPAHIRKLRLLFGVTLP